MKWWGRRERKCEQWKSQIHCMWPWVCTRCIVTYPNLSLSSPHKTNPLFHCHPSFISTISPFFLLPSFSLFFFPYLIGFPCSSSSKLSHAFVSSIYIRWRFRFLRCWVSFLLSLEGFSAGNTTDLISRVFLSCTYVKALFFQW